jgi:hypothetical protein
MYNFPDRTDSEEKGQPTHIESQYVDTMREAETIAGFLAQQFNRVQVYHIGEHGHEALFEYLDGKLHMRTGYAWV